MSRHATSHSAESAPMSSAQEQLWLLDQMLAETQAYNVQSVFRLRGDVEPNLFARTLCELVHRHASLRTSLDEANGVTQQRLWPPSALTLPLSWHDLRRSDPEVTAGEVARLAERDCRTPFALDQAPLWRALLARTGEREHVLVLTMHHAVTDAASMQLLVAEVCRLYAAFRDGLPSPLPPLSTTMTDVALEEQRIRQSDAFARQRAYWREQLAGAPEALRPLAGRPWTPTPHQHGAVITRSLPKPVSARVEALGRRLRASSFMVCLASYVTLLHRYTARTDIVVGTTFSTRGPGQEGVLGNFVNCLPLRVDVSGSPTFEELVHRVRRTVLGALRHQAVPFGQIVRDVADGRPALYHPVFQTLFSLTRLKDGWHNPGLEAEPVPGPPGATAKFDLSLLLDQNAAGLRVVAEYATALYDREPVERLVRTWAALLDKLTDAPATRVDDPSLPSPEVRDRPDPEPVAAATTVPGRLMDAAASAGAEPDSKVDVDAVVAIWSDVMGVDALGPGDDFFELGGHSLLAIRITARVSAAWDVDLPMTLLLQHPVLRDFASAVADVLAQAEGPPPPAGHPAALTNATSEDLR
ncbi:condensation domain-containing protein [Streptomyces flaveolus]|uniref:condensation domain-containing protein n=1 Tax=Streptomyces flaveolus TaxID=67297 RepID=UPI0033C98BEA